MKSLEQLTAEMKDKLMHLMPEFEIEEKAKIAHQILKIKEEKNAVILGHNYMEAALFHSIPDFTGDSLELCRLAAETDKDIIVFCGVKFMAESAKILNPNKKVLCPSPKAGCSLAESITVEDIRGLRKQFPDMPVIAYINTYADIKAEIDLCCTSGNAKKVVESFGDQPIIFLPDQYLAGNVARETGRKIIYMSRNPEECDPIPEDLTNVIIGWKGACEVHEQFTVQDIENVRKQLPDVCVLAHPECPTDVCEAADYSGSTSEMIKFIEEVDKPRYLLLTECAMGDNIAAAHKDKEMVRLCSIRCPHMGEITLEDTLEALQKEQYEIHLEEDLRQKALASVERMLTIK